MADTDVTQRDGFTTPVTSDFCCCSNQFEPVAVELRRVVRNNDTTKTAVYWNLYSPIMSYWFHIYIKHVLASILYVYITYPDFLPQHITNLSPVVFVISIVMGLVGPCHAAKRWLTVLAKHFRFELQLWCPGITPQNWFVWLYFLRKYHCFLEETEGTEDPHVARAFVVFWVKQWNSVKEFLA